jgi:ribose/xylose/arabinose/galactoside ABC-type transport system permease subunit
MHGLINLSVPRVIEIVMYIAAPLLMWALVGWLLAIVLIIIMRLLRGRMSLHGLLATNADQQANPERMVLLVTSVGAALYYLITGMTIEMPADLTKASLPEVPNEVLLLLSCAQTGYLSGKSFRLFKGT